jgi:hypothetical protein
LGPSISNIAVNVSMNTASLAKGAQQASNAVKSFAAQTRQAVSGTQGVANGIGNVSQIAQQGVFAIDDFFAAFATGGVAGGMRGAANNLTMIAASLGGIKAQLLLIAALSVGQLLAKQFDKARDSINEAEQASRKFQEALERTAGGPARELATRGNLAGIARESSLSGGLESQREGRESITAMQNRLTAERKVLADLRQVAASVVGGGSEEATRERIAQTEESARKLRDEIREQKRLNEAIDARVQALQREATIRQTVALAVGAAGLSGPLGGAGGGFDLNALRKKNDEERARIDEELFNIKNKGAMSLSEVFSKFGSANQMGSIGAISTMNAGQYGPGNARDGGVQREQLREQRRIRELMERRKELEVVPL